LLTVGATAGIALAAWGLVGSGPATPSLEGAVAVVNGQPLSREAFDRFVVAVAEERRTAVLPLEERQRMLDRLVDEELLLQHGLGLGLARHEPTARRVIVQSVIAAVTGAAEDVDPSEADLREYYARNPDRFVRSGRITVEALAAVVGPRGQDGAGDEAARALATRAAASLKAGATLSEVRAALPGMDAPPLPAGPLPAETIRRYLGPTAALRARSLGPGEVTEPFRASASYLVLRGLDRQEERVPPFEEVAAQVRAEWVRTRGEEALRRFLDDLRAAAELEQADLAAEPGRADLAVEAPAGAK